MEQDATCPFAPSSYSFVKLLSAVFCSADFFAVGGYDDSAVIDYNLLVNNASLVTVCPHRILKTLNADQCKINSNSDFMKNYAFYSCLGSVFLLNRVLIQAVTGKDCTGINVLGFKAQNEFYHDVI